MACTRRSTRDIWESQYFVVGYERDVKALHKANAREEEKRKVQRAQEKTERKIQRIQELQAELAKLQDEG